MVDGEDGVTQGIIFMQGNVRSSQPDTILLIAFFLLSTLHGSIGVHLCV